MTNCSDKLEKKILSGEQITGAEAILLSFLEEGVETMFGYPGGAIMPLYDALHQSEECFHHILTRHEQGAIHAAQGFARVTGKTGVCLATSGPGSPGRKVSKASPSDTTCWTPSSRNRASESLSGSTASWISASIPMSMLKKGDVLFKIDPIPFQNQVDSLTARIILAREDAERARTLLTSRNISQRDADAAFTRLENLSGQLLTAEFELDMTIVRAPTDGYVIQMALRPGMRAASLAGYLRAK